MTTNSTHANEGIKVGTALPSGSIDWSKWLEENVKTLVVGGLVLIVLIFGGGYYYNAKNKSKSEHNTKIFQFQQTGLTEFSKDHDANKLMVNFKTLHTSVGNYVGLLPTALKTADQLNTNGKKQEALEVLAIASKITSNEYATYFVNTRLAAINEDLGKNQEALETLEKLSKSKVDIFPGKTYLDLGRIYLKLGNKDKAKANFQYVIEKAKDDAEFVKIAKIYLSNL